MMLADSAMFHVTRDTGDALGVRDPLTEAGVLILRGASFSLLT